MSILGLLNQTVTISPQSSRGADGETVFGDAVSVKSRFEAVTKRILLPDSQVLTIDAFVVVGPTITVSTGDKVTYDSNDYKVVDVFEVPGGSGSVEQKELRLVKWPST